MRHNGYHNGRERIETFVEKAKQNGYITFDEVLGAFPEPEQEMPLLESLLERLEEAGVEVQKGPVEPDEEETDESGRFTYVPDADAITLYFREVSATPLLTHEEEVALAQQIERGHVARKTLSSEELSSDERVTLEQAVEAGEHARHKLITANARLVISLAKRRVDQGVPLLDLIQEGNIGLMRAVDKFDWRRGHKFSTYATWWVRQALTRAVADQGRTIRLPVHRCEQLRVLHKVARELANELGRDPKTEELAERLCVPSYEVERLVQDAQRPLSLSRPAGEDGESQLGEFLESDGPLTTDVIEKEALTGDIRELLASLPSREARVLELRYGLRDGYEYTLKEVGERFGLTRERIRQIEGDALHRLRNPLRTQKLRAYIT